MAADTCDHRPGITMFNGARILDEIRFAQAHTKNSPPGQHGAETARNGFDFGKFRHTQFYTTFSICFLILGF